MNIEKTGKAIAKARKKCGLTQEQLAEKAGVSVQAVSKWETGKNLPDIENLMFIAEFTNTPYQTLLATDELWDSAAGAAIRSRLFHEENMFTRMKTLALAEKLPETYKALQYMREQHAGQFRKKGKFTDEEVRYINHPLLMACQAHAFGIRDDALLASILLHDVVEDTEVSTEELPFSDEVKEIVNLVTFPDSDKTEKKAEEEKEKYFAAIRENGKACVVKIIDRCNNVSTMAGSFSREKLISYTEETEKYVLPLMTVLKNEYPEYSDLAFLVKYQITSILETVKNLLVM